jgi:hypothetical protein
MEKVFDSCVQLLENISKKSGCLSYKEVNVIIFCAAWPALTIWLGVKAFRRN